MFCSNQQFIGYQVCLTIQMWGKTSKNKNGNPPTLIVNWCLQYVLLKLGKLQIPNNLSSFLHTFVPKEQEVEFRNS